MKANKDRGTSVGFTNLDWVDVNDRLPDGIGNYWCKNEYAEFPCFYVHTLKGNLVWLKVHEDVIITHWKNKKPNE